MKTTLLYEEEVGLQFSNIQSYNQNMAKGLEDKLFFLKYLPFGQLSKDKLTEEHPYLFVDFGCADGTLLAAMVNVLENLGIQANLVGYDISETMISIANGKYGSCGTENIQVTFTSNWSDVEEYLQDDNFVRVVILSSVIHEVYSYASSESDITTFWKRICWSGFDYICVRDMMPQPDMDRLTDKSLLETFYSNQKKNKPELDRYISEFQNKWGSINNNKNFVHYLLKYRWLTNWRREVNENYFPINTAQFASKVRSFSTVYTELFRVPFLENCWLEDFGVRISDSTHIKYVGRNWQHDWS